MNVGQNQTFPFQQTENSQLTNNINISAGIGQVVNI